MSSGQSNDGGAAYGGVIPVSPYYFPYLKTLVNMSLIGTTLMGVYTLMVMLSIYVLVRGGITQRRQITLVAVLLWMYILTAARYASVISSFMALVNDPSKENTLTSTFAISQLILISVTSITSDAVVLWRAHVIWGPNRFMYAVSAFLLVFTVVGFSVSLADVVRNFYTNSVSENEGDSVVGALSIACIVLTNLWATCIVATKAWIYRKQIATVHRQNRSRLLEKLLFLMIESGFLYCVFWVVSLAACVREVDNGNPSPSSHDFQFLMVMFTMLPQIVGIYPTIVIVVVALQRTTGASRDLFTATGPGSLTTVPTLPRSDAGASSGTSSQGSKRKTRADAEDASVVLQLGPVARAPR